ncbi:MAG TPA: hypothetical protein VER33_27070 [Polyangiaceae bacterium]|nr:hypothetical protein [Polyangiaceae bacterium]
MWQPLSLALHLSIASASAPATHTPAGRTSEPLASAAFLAPPGVLSERLPPPRGEAPELAARQYELAARLEAARAECSVNDAQCGGLVDGAGAGIVGLYRPTAFFAVGLSLHASSLWGASAGSAASRSARAWYGGVTGRVYPLEPGACEPYVELSLGAGKLQADTRSRHERVSEKTSWAPAARVAGGLDFSVGGELWLGPVLSWSRYAPSGVERCAPTCGWISARKSEIPFGALSLGVQVRLALGEAL